MIERAWEQKIEPRAVRISAAVRITGLSRSRIYELIQSGALETTRVGRATLGQYRSPKSLTGNNAASPDARSEASEAGGCAIRRAFKHIVVEDLTPPQEGVIDLGKPGPRRRPRPSSR